MREAWDLGYDRLSLTTYRDLPWNGPFYARLGFVEAAHPEPFELHRREHEQRSGWTGTASAGRDGGRTPA